MHHYSVNEIFYSLQGEGANTGKPAIFIRFSGCNLCCSFCDTDFQNGIDMSGEEILRQMSKYPSHFVVLTGGEPSLQIDDELVTMLHTAGYTIAIETNGTHTLPNGIDWVTLSPKEGSTIVLTRADELKIVYTGQDVEHYATVIEAPLHYLQPVCRQADPVPGQDNHTTDNRKNVIDYCLQHPHWRLSLQTHKILHIQ